MNPIAYFDSAAMLVFTMFICGVVLGVLIGAASVAARRDDIAFKQQQIIAKLNAALVAKERKPINLAGSEAAHRQISERV